MSNVDRITTHTETILKTMSTLFGGISDAYAQVPDPSGEAMREYCLLLALVQVMAATSLQQNVAANYNATPIEKLQIQAGFLQEAQSLFAAIRESGVIKARGTTADGHVDMTLATMPAASRA